MQAFTDFMLTVTYPPNPNRRLDNTLTDGQQAGHDLFFGRETDILFNCNGCHTLDPVNGMFGTSAFSTFEGETQMFKVPHLRNVYTKVGMFGRPTDAPRGPQVRGFGVLHDGSIDTVRRFLGASVFQLTAGEQNDLERFVFVFDSDMNPIVGQQVTLDSTNLGVGQITNRVNLMLTRDDALECEVVVKGTIAGEARGGYRLSDGTFQMDRAGDVRAEPDLRALAATPGQELTYTCVPPGSGVRIGVDRDEDGVFDRDELDVGSEPGERGPHSRDADPCDQHRAQGRRGGTDRSDEAPTEASLERLPGRPDPDRPTGLRHRRRSDADGQRRRWGRGHHSRRHGGESRADVRPARVRLDPTSSGYKYADKRNLYGPISSISIRSGRLKLSGRGAGLYSLADAPYGAFTVRLEIGARTGFCVTADAKEPTASNDTTARFNGTRNPPIPAACPPRP
jgi:hypothetical protein